MPNEVFTFADEGYEGATYTVRPMLANEDARSKNIALSLCQQYAIKHQMVLPTQVDSDGNQYIAYGSSATYPYDLYEQAVTFARNFLVTTITGKPRHLVPKTSLDLSRLDIFEKWVQQADERPALIAIWREARKRANAEPVTEDEKNDSAESSTDS